MEHSSQGTDGPLLPVHNTDVRFSSASGDPPTSPSRQQQQQPRQSQREGPFSDGVNIEVDIADRDRNADEKAEGDPARPPKNANVRTATPEDEQQVLDWIVPVHNSGNNGIQIVEKRRTVDERLETTLAIAKVEQLKYEQRAKYAGMAINAAMFAQIVSNALITGLSAASSNRQAQIGVSALGALNTVISSFLVRVRGTREPERSISHSQNLEKFIRELEAFKLDEGLSRDSKWDARVHQFRTDFDRLQTAVHQSENGHPMS